MMPVEKKLHTGLDALLYRAYGSIIRVMFSTAGLRREAEAAAGESERALLLDESAFDRWLIECRSSMRMKSQAGALSIALGCVAAAVKHTIGVLPYVEQLMGALCMSSNTVVQMQTGEGKTITAAMAAVIAAWRGGPCHVVTSNDYLASRDVELMQALFQKCGVTAAAVVSGLTPEERKQAYSCDIVYSTSKELLADFLRDKIAAEGKSPDTDALFAPAGQVMRGLQTAIIDEADSVLIDEATVPLIISMPCKNSLLHEAVVAARAIAAPLKRGEDFLFSGRGLQVLLNDQGKEKVQKTILGLPAIWQSPERAEYLVSQALMADHCYQRDVHYVIVDGKVVIVDDRTGRIMDGRSWSSGLHQAIEAKEGVELTDPTYSHTQMSFQRFFRLYRNLSGMSGTLQNVKAELWSVYGLKTVIIPTHRPKQLTHWPERVFMTSELKWQAVVNEVRAVVRSGRAVLVGTHSVKESEELYGQLVDAGIDAVVLNALRHEEEAAIIAEAGMPGRVTVATNMAGRGTDIKVHPDVLAKGGMHVVATERHESRRVDMQLFGRTARQGMPGTARMISCLEDTVARHYSWKWLLLVVKKQLGSQFGELLAVFVIQCNQLRAELVKAAMRKRMLVQDIRQTKLLAFANH